MKTCLPFVIALFTGSLLYYPAFSQTPAIQQTKLYGTANLLQFEAGSLPPLAPLHPTDYRRQARRTYFWKFGDGGFSFEQAPVYTYRQAGTFTAVMESTRIYSDDDIDESEVDRAAAPVIVNFAAGYRSGRTNPEADLQGKAIRLLTNRAPRSGDSITYIITYQNTCPLPDIGSLYFLYTPQQLRLKYTEQYGAETYNGSLANTNGQLQWNFSGLNPSEKRNIFISMAADTSVQAADTIITRLVIQSACTTDTISVLKTAVKSHDPNRKLVTPQTLCPANPQPLCFTIEFQNIGSAPAQTVQLRDYMSLLLDTATFVHTESSHPQALTMVVEPVNNRLALWQFTNINLPGTKQAGFGTQFTEKDTKGFVTFCITPNLPLEPCAVIPNRAEIIFDCNLPIPTNTVFVQVQQPDCTPCCQICPNTALTDAAYIPHFGFVTDMAQVLCPGSGFPGTQTRYLWYPDVFLENPFTPQFLFFDTDGNIPAITYTLTAWNPLMCWAATDSITVYMGGCFNGDTLQITQPTVANPSCPDASDAELLLNITGGTPPYTLYSYNGCYAVNSSFTLDLDSLPPGEFPVAVEDANQCIVRDTFIIASPLSLWTDAFVTHASCCTCPDGQILLATSGGKPPYTCMWQNGAADSLQTGLASGIYNFTVTDAENCTFHGAAAVQHPVKFYLKAFLQGAYDATAQLMRTTLNQQGLLPMQQPFNQPPWNYAGTETLLQPMPANITDWVLLDFVDNNNWQQTVVQTAALLWNNGNITDVFAASDTMGLHVCGLTANTPYRIIVRHRNHLAVMSNNAINYPTNTGFNFTTAAAQAAGNQQQTDVAPGIFALFTGDMNANGVITVSDFNLFAQQAGAINQYLAADCNLDKAVTIADFNFFANNAGKIGFYPVRY